MEPLIEKAAQGNRLAMTQLSEASKTAVYKLSYMLLLGSDQAVSATNLAIKSTFQAVQKGMIASEAGFVGFALKQAANYCKKETGKHDPRAFKLPSRKDFRISSISERQIDTDIGITENYILCLPAAQRFVFVLQNMTEMSDLQMAKVVGLHSGAIALISEAEADNLSKIHRALEAAGISSDAPTKESVKDGFAVLAADIALPEAVTVYLEGYIDSVATPVEEAAKARRKKIATMIAVTVACIVIFVVGILANEIYTFSTSGETDATTASTDAATTEPVPAVELDPESVYYADIEIADYGTITVELDQETAPITVANFVSLAQSGFYDGLTFHRIMEGFMMQGGDPNGDGTGGSENTIVGEFSANGYDNDISHTRGVISMARASSYNSASSQFFIVHEDSSDSLDGLYAAFGYVTEGMDVVDAICTAAEPTDNNGTISAEDQPVITSITIRTVPAEDTAEE